MNEEEKQPVDLGKALREHMKALGSKGGSAGKGAVKSRGTREYYVGLRAKSGRHPVKVEKKDDAQSGDVAGAGVDWGA